MWKEVWRMWSRREDRWISQTDSKQFRREESRREVSSVRYGREARVMTPENHWVSSWGYLVAQQGP